MEDLAALSRGSKLPMRIIQDRPHEQNKKLLWGDKKRKSHTKMSRKRAQSATPQQKSRDQKDAKWPDRKKGSRKI